MDNSKILKVGFINIRGQTGLKLPKHLQIENFIRENCLDILHLQESNIEEDTFSECTLIASSFNLIVNNSQNKYGTSFIGYNINVPIFGSSKTVHRILLGQIHSIKNANFSLDAR